MAGSTPPNSFVPPSQVKILLLENVHKSAHEVFNNAGFKVEAVPSALKEAELQKKIEGVHVLGIRSKTQLTPAVLEAAKDLLVCGAFCIGTNQIALDVANMRGVPAFNAPFSNTRSVAELIVCEIIALSRQLGDRSSEVHAGKWRKVATNCHEVRGKTVGIVGYGHIGSQVGVLCEAVGMRVVYFDIRATLPMGNNRSMQSLGELLEQSDFVTLHVPETPATKHMIGAGEIAKMKPGTCLLNMSRGTVVVIDALAAALKDGRLGGAAVDVYPSEPESNSDGFETPLRGLPNVILTPHVGGSTEEAQEAIGREVASSLVRFLTSGATTGAVNFPVIDMPPVRGGHRILNVHKNVPGVLRDINKIVSDHSANIQAQVLATDANIGYLIMDINVDVSNDVRKGIAALGTSIKTRILY
jgi:D-3-phosphoglycerate dehydrogenase